MKRSALFGVAMGLALTAAAGAQAPKAGAAPKAAGLQKYLAGVPDVLILNRDGEKYQTAEFPHQAHGERFVLRFWSIGWRRKGGLSRVSQCGVTSRRGSAPGLRLEGYTKQDVRVALGLARA